MSRVRVVVDKDVIPMVLARQIAAAKGLAIPPEIAWNGREGWIETDAPITEQELQSFVNGHDAVRDIVYDYPTWLKRLWELSNKTDYTEAEIQEGIRLLMRLARKQIRQEIDARRDVIQSQRGN